MDLRSMDPFDKGTSANQCLKLDIKYIDPFCENTSANQCLINKDGRPSVAIGSAVTGLIRKIPPQTTSITLGYSGCCLIALCQASENPGK